MWADERITVAEENLTKISWERLVRCRIVGYPDIEIRGLGHWKEITQQA